MLDYPDQEGTMNWTYQIFRTIIETALANFLPLTYIFGESL